MSLVVRLMIISSSSQGECMGKKESERLRKNEMAFNRFSFFLDCARKNLIEPPLEFSEHLAKLGKGNRIRAWQEYVYPWMAEIKNGRTEEEVWSGLPYAMKSIFKED